MSAFDDYFAEKAAAAPDPDPWAQATLPPSPAPSSEPSWFDRGVEAIAYPFGILKHGADALARKVAEAEGLNVREGMTEGQMLRAAAGLSAEQNRAEHPDSYWRPIVGRATEFVGDLVGDPLTWLLGGAGKIAKGGLAAAELLRGGGLGAEAAEAAMQALRAGKVASNVERVAGAAFTPGMLSGAYHEGRQALEDYQRQGFSPEVAEKLFGSAASGYFGYQGARHALHTPEGFSLPEAPPAAEPAAVPVDVGPEIIPGDVNEWHGPDLLPEQKFARVRAQEPRSRKVDVNFWEQLGQSVGTPEEALANAIAENVTSPGAPRLGRTAEGLGELFNLSEKARAEADIASRLPPPPPVRMRAPEWQGPVMGEEMQGPVRGTEPQGPFEPEVQGPVLGEDMQGPAQSIGQQLLNKIRATVDRAGNTRRLAEMLGMHGTPEEALGEAVAGALASPGEPRLGRPAPVEGVNLSPRARAAAGIPPEPPVRPGERVPFKPKVVKEGFDALTHEQKDNVRKTALMWAEQILSDQTGQPVGKYPIMDAATGKPTGEWRGQKSHKARTPFADIKYTSTEMVKILKKAIESGKDGVAARKMYDAVIAKDPQLQEYLAREVVVPEARAASVEAGHAPVEGNAPEFVTEGEGAGEEISPDAPDAEQAPTPTPTPEEAPAPAPKEDIFARTKRRTEAQTAQREAFVQEHGEVPFEAAGGENTSWQDWTFTGTKSVRSPGKWQLTRFDKSGEPTGHSEHGTYLEMLREAQREYGVDMSKAQREAPAPAPAQAKAPVTLDDLLSGVTRAEETRNVETDAAKAGVPFMIPKNAMQALADLGYTKEQRNAMAPEQAMEILATQQRAPELARTGTDALPPRDRRVQSVPVATEQRLAERSNRPASEIDRIIRELHPDQLKEQHPETYELAYVDPLTGLGNRRLYNRIIGEHKGPVSSIDLGGLGYVNDKLGGGHALGDAFLKAFADVARKVKEKYGVEIIRAGEKSDEFAALGSGDLSMEEAMKYMQEEFSNAEFHGQVNGEPVTFTGGRADYGIGRRGQASTAAERFKVGDAELYAARELAKKAGLRASSKGERPPGLREVRAEPGPGNVPDQVPPTGGREEVAAAGGAGEPPSPPKQGRALEAEVPLPEGPAENITQTPEERAATAKALGFDERSGMDRATWEAKFGGGRPAPPTPPAGGTAGAPVGGSTRQGINLWHRLVLPWLENVKKVPGVGPKIAEIITAGKREWEAHASRQSHEYLKAINDLNGKEWTEAQAGLEGAEVTNPKVAAAVKTIRAILDDVAKRADQAGVFIDYTKDYFPHFSKDGRWSFEQMVEKRAADKNISIAEAASELHEARRRGEFTLDRKSAALERERTGEIEDYRKDKGVLVDYLVESNRRIAEANHYGPRLEKLRTLAGHIGNQGDHGYVWKGIERMTGREGPLPGAKVGGALRGLEGVTKLATGPISQLGSIVQTVFEGGARNAAKGLMESIGKYGNAELEAIKSGAAFPNIGGEAQSLTGVDKTWTQKLPYLRGTQFVDKFMRVVADRTANNLIPDLHKKAAKGDARATAALKDLGIDASKPLTEEALLHGRKNFSERTQYRTDLTETPLWATTPAGRVATQFLHFAYQQTRFINRAVGEAMGGRPKPLSRYLATLVAAGLVGEVGNDLKAVMKGYGVQGDDPDSWEDVLSSKRVRADLHNPKSLLMRAVQNSIFAGLGLYQTAVERATSAKNPVDLVGGPLVGDVYALGNKAMQGDVAGLRNEAIRRTVPLFGNQIVQEFGRSAQDVKEKGDRPAVPGWIGRGRDVIAGKESVGDALMRGLVTGGSGTPDREEIARLERQHQANRDAKAALQAQYPGLAQTKEKTLTEKLGREARASQRMALVRQIMEALSSGDRQLAHTLARKGKRLGFGFGKDVMRNLEAAAAMQDMEAE